MQAFYDSLQQPATTPYASMLFGLMRLRLPEAQALRSALGWEFWQSAQS